MQKRESEPDTARHYLVGSTAHFDGWCASICPDLFGLKIAKKTF